MSKGGEPDGMAYIGKTKNNHPKRVLMGKSLQKKGPKWSAQALPSDSEAL